MCNAKVAKVWRSPWDCIKELEKIKKWHPKKMRVAIQGFVNAAQPLAQLLYQDGYKIVAVSDSIGGIYRAQCFDIPSIIYAKNKFEQVQAVIQCVKWLKQLK